MKRLTIVTAILTAVMMGCLTLSALVAAEEAITDP